MKSRKLVLSLIILAGFTTLLILAIFIFTGIFQGSYRNPEAGRGMALYFAFFFFFFFSPAALVPMILSWSFFSIPKKLVQVPFGLKYIRTVNLTLLFAGGGILLTGLTIPLYFQWVRAAGRLADSIVVGGIILAVGLLLAYGIGMLNRDLLLVRKNAVKIQTVLSWILLLFFPIGTLFYGAALYFLLWDQETRKFLGTVPPSS